MAFERILILALIFIIGAAWVFLVSKKRVLLVIGTIIILAVAIGYCLVMANRYKAHNTDCVSTDKENIIREMPSLEFSDEEMSRFKDILKTTFITAYRKNGEQKIPEKEIRAFLNDVIPSDAARVSATLYDNSEANNSLGYLVLNIIYTMDELEIYVNCYDTGSVTKIINKNSGKTIYENENNEHFRKYVQRRNWFAWMKNERVGNDITEITLTDSPELEPLTIYNVRGESAGMVGPVVKSEWINSNPWTEESQLSTLPVFRNTWELSENYANASADPKEMKKLLVETAKYFGFNSYPYEIENRTYHMRAKMKGIEIVVNDEMITRIYFDPGVKLPAKYNISNVASYDEKLEAAKYIRKTYKELIGMKDPQINISNGYYDSKSYSLSFFEGDTDLTGQIVNYNFNKIVFSGNEEGLLSMITIYRPDLSQKVGDYPLISVDEAKELLADGYFYTIGGSWTRDEQGNIVYNLPVMEWVKFVELIYDSESSHNVYIPYYVFYAGVYYLVPAIVPQYITNMPEGRYPDPE